MPSPTARSCVGGAAVEVGVNTSLQPRNMIPMVPLTTENAALVT